MKFSIFTCINFGLNIGARRSWWLMGNRMEQQQQQQQTNTFCSLFFNFIFYCRLHFCLHQRLGSRFRDWIFNYFCVFIWLHNTNYSLAKCISHNQLYASDLMNFFFIFFLHLSSTLLTICISLHCRLTFVFILFFLCRFIFQAKFKLNAFNKIHKAKEKKDSFDYFQLRIHLNLSLKILHASCTWT